jgi:uncharacterized protein
VVRPDLPGAGRFRVIAIDTNLLVYAHRADATRHARARSRLAELLESGRACGLPWPCVHEFLAIVTHPKIFRPPSTHEQALGALHAWLAAPAISLLGEGPDHLSRLSNLIRAGSIRGAKVHDARVAAICLSHGVTALWTADRDFSYFPELPTENPLVG